MLEGVEGYDLPSRGGVMDSLSLVMEGGVGERGLFCVGKHPNV